jgi:hypothetical protein
MGENIKNLDKINPLNYKVDLNYIFKIHREDQKSTNKIYYT